MGGHTAAKAYMVVRHVASRFELPLCADARQPVRVECSNSTRGTRVENRGLELERVERTGTGQVRVRVRVRVRAFCRVPAGRRATQS